MILRAVVSLVEDLQEASEAMQEQLLRSKQHTRDEPLIRFRRASLDSNLMTQNSKKDGADVGATLSKTARSHSLPLRNSLLYSEEN